MFKLDMRRGTMLLGGGLVLERVFMFTSSAILARLLVPQDFGLVTMASTVTEALGLLGNLGLSSAIVHKRDEEDSYATAALLVSLGIAVGMAALQASVAGWAAVVYRSPLVAPLLRLYAIGYLINAVGVVPGALLARHLEYSFMSSVSVASALMYGIVSVAFAKYGFGVWSLAIGRLASQFVSTLLNWWLCRWRPSRWPKGRHYQGLLSYGRNMLVSDGLGYVSHNADYMILGREAGPSILGTYALAYNLAMLPVTTVTNVLGRTAFPIFARLQNQTDEMQHAFVSTLRYAAAAGFPVLMGMAVLADDLVPLLFGPGWETSVVLLRLLAVYALGRTLSGHGGQLMNAIGRPDIPMKFTLVYTPVLVAGLWVMARWGALGVAAGTAVISGVGAWVYLALAMRVMRWPLRLAWTGIGSSLISALVMGVLILAGRQSLVASGVALLPRTVGLVFLGVALYGGVLSRFHPDLLRQASVIAHSCSAGIKYRLAKPR